MIEEFKTAARQGRIEIYLQACFVGEDLQLIIAGGDRPHIGAVAVSICPPGLKNSEAQEMTTSVVTVPGHKEDQLAREAAHQVAVAIGRTVSVSCGIHLEQISKQEIQVVQELVRTLVDELVVHLKANSP